MRIAMTTIMAPQTEMLVRGSERGLIDYDGDSVVDVRRLASSRPLCIWLSRLCISVVRLSQGLLGISSGLLGCRVRTAATAHTSDTLYILDSRLQEPSRK